MVTSLSLLKTRERAYVIGVAERWPGSMFVPALLITDMGSERIIYLWLFSRRWSRTQCS